VRLESFAKVNLFLEVLGLLPGNYHEIETLLCSVSLSDTLRFALTKSPGIKLWSNLPEMNTESNLVHRVAAYMLRQYSPAGGVDISLEKRIPIAAGLGGGSSNAATTIIALNILWDLDLSLPDMEGIATEFGSDIPYFLHGGTAWATHRGEKVSPLPDLQLEMILLVNPHIGISAAEAYGLLPDVAANSRRLFSPGTGYDWMFNRLEAGIRGNYAVVDNILANLEDLGAAKALMSGSGSTCLGIFKGQAKLDECQRFFAGKGYWTKAVRTISRKEYQSVFEA
jgi:4-diphosphocytidyl-2-C-methyl-D-erythritol kinase